MTRVSSKKEQWTEKRLLLKATIITDSRVEAVVITMEEADAVNIVIVPPTEGRDLEVGAVIAREGIALVRRVGGQGPGTAALDLGTGDRETGDPDPGQSDGPALQEEDRGIGDDAVLAAHPHPHLPPQAAQAPVPDPDPGVGPGHGPDLGEISQVAVPFRFSPSILLTFLEKYLREEPLTVGHNEVQTFTC